MLSLSLEDHKKLQKEGVKAPVSARSLSVDVGRAHDDRQQVVRVRHTYSMFVCLCVHACIALHCFAGSVVLEGEGAVCLQNATCCPTEVFTTHTSQQSLISPQLHPHMFNYTYRCVQMFKYTYRCIQMFKYKYSINVQIHIQMHSDVEIHIQHSCANTHTDAFRCSNTHIEAFVFKCTHRCIHVQIRIQHKCSNTHTAFMCKYTYRCTHV